MKDNDDLFGSTLCQESPFTRLFDDCMPTETNAEMEDTTLKANKYYIANKFRAFHTRYMHLFPFSRESCLSLNVIGVIVRHCTKDASPV